MRSKSKTLKRVSKDTGISKTSAHLDQLTKKLNDRLTKTKIASKAAKDLADQLSLLKKN
jgi:hypothetical protein